MNKGFTKTIRLFSAVLASVLMIGSIPFSAKAAETGKEIRILYTHDVHSYFTIAKEMTDDGVHEHGGAARLKTLLDENQNDHSIYVDGGDFAMGTMLQAGYSTDAYELRLLGELGCAVTTYGNHEFDYGGYGVAKMLNAAMDSGDKLPKLVSANLNFDGNLTDEQTALKSAMDEYGAVDYTVEEVNGVKIAFFGLLGIDGVECAPSSGQVFDNYIESAKATVKEIQDNTDADIIVCLSHSGTSGDGETGEDFDLAKAVPDIDIIISGHSHTKYDEAISIGDTTLVCAGCYLQNLGCLDIVVNDGKVQVVDYKNIACDENVPEDPDFKEKVDGYLDNIENTYLADEDVSYDSVVAHSNNDFMTLSEMYATHQEYPMGNLIADSYIYEAKANGIDDIDVALVGLGTIRGSFFEGDITASDIFESCSLGVGADGSAGHPIVSAYITGKELKLMVELDASLGPMVSAIKMSYSGLRYTFNTNRMLLDRVTEVYLVDEDGNDVPIEDDKLYKVCCNVYAVNMLGMLNGLTKGILKIEPKYADGTKVEDFYTCSLIDTDGKEIKEWVALKDYLASFDEENGVPTIPDRYSSAEGRKVKVSKGGLAVIANPGLTTGIVMGIVIVIIAIIVIIIATHKSRKAKRIAKKEAKKAAKAAKKAE